MLASLFSRKKVRTRKTGCLGKLPCHGDFLRLNAVHEELRWIEGWVQQGIAASYQSLGPEWTVRFDTAPPARIFASRPDTGRILCVRFKPARDSVGRRYPFLMFHLQGPQTSLPGLAPLVPAMESFFEKARDVAARGRSPGPRGEFLRHVEALNRTQVPLHEPSRFEEWLENQTAGDFFTRALGRVDDPGRYALVCRVLAAAAAPHPRGFALRLPECCHPGDTAFWTALIQRRRRSMGAPFTLLWSRPMDGAPMPPVVLLGEPAPEHFLLLLDPRLESAGVADAAPGPRERPEVSRRLHRHFAHLLDDPDLPLRMLLDYLCMLDSRSPLAHLVQVA